MRVHAIVVTHNAQKWVDACVGSLLHSALPVHVIVVDNASSDSTVAYIREHYPSVELVSMNENVGFGAANNVGLRLALAGGCDAVYLMNQDAWVHPETLACLTKCLEDFPEYGVVSPIHENRGGTLERGFAEYCGESVGCKYFSDLHKGGGFVQPVYDIQFVNAAHWLIRRECLLDVGGFAPVFYHYGEDGNFLQRVWHEGWKVGICPDAHAVHDRAGRAPSLVRDVQQLYASYLLFACNPNCPTIRTLPGAWRRLVVNLLLMDGRTSEIFWEQVENGIRDIPKILATRKITRSRIQQGQEGRFL